MKEYNAYCADYTTHKEESPDCPSGWRGSGVYDTVYYGADLHRFKVWADDGTDIADMVRDEGRKGPYEELSLLFSEPTGRDDGEDGWGGPEVTEHSVLHTGLDHESRFNVMDMYTEDEIIEMFCEEDDYIQES